MCGFVASRITADATRRSGKVKTELSDYYKSYRHKTVIKFNLKPECCVANIIHSAF